MDNFYLTNSDSETQHLGEQFAKEILKKSPQNKAVVLALSGDLGAGKTTFTQGFAKGLGVEEKVLSPTFIVMRKFKIPPPKPFTLNPIPFKYFYHLDCYRLDNYEDILTLGLNETMNNPENIILIEWPEKIKNALPKDVITIDFKHSQEGKRELTINF